MTSVRVCVCVCVCVCAHAEWLLHGPLPYRVLASLAFACALYFHLSYFFNIMAFANIILFDQEPEVRVCVCVFLCNCSLQRIHWWNLRALSKRCVCGLVHASRQHNCACAWLPVVST